MAITIAELKAVLTADTAPLEGSLSRMESRLQRSANVAEQTANRATEASQRVTQANERRAAAVVTAAEAEIRAEESATLAEEKRAAAATAAGELVIASQRAQVAAIRQGVNGVNLSTKTVKAAFEQQAQAAAASAAAVMEAEAAQSAAVRASAAAVSARTNLVRTESAATSAALKAEAAAAEATAAGTQAAMLRQTAAVVTARKAITAAWTGFANLASIVTVLGAGTAIASAQFEDMTQRIIGNTQLSQKQIGAMRQTIISLSSATGSTFEDLANGYKETTDFGYTAAQSARVLSIANQEAIASGSDLTTTVNLLASKLHEFNLPVTKASEVMNTLHLAAAQGNTTMGEFVKASALALGQAANYGVGLRDVVAALSALTLHGFNAARASTQIAGILVKITNPSKQAADAIATLSKMTGVDLVNDFTAAGLRAKGLTGVLDDVKRATGGNIELVNRLIPAMRGGQGAISLMGSGAADYKRILNQLAETMSGKATPGTEAFNARMNTTSQRFRVLVQQIKAEFLPIGDKFIVVFQQAVPGLKIFASAVASILGWFTKLPMPVQQVVLAVGTFNILAKTILPSLSSLIKFLPLAAEGFALIGPTIELLSGPVGWIVLAITALVAAWKLNLGDIQGKTYAFYNWLKSTTGVAMQWFSDQFGQAWTAIVDWTKETWPEVRRIIENVWTVLAPFVGTAVGTIWGLIKTAWAGIVAVTQSLWPVLRSSFILIFGTIADVVSFFTKLLSGDWSGAWYQLIDTVKNLGSRLWDTVKSVFASIADLITGIIPSFVTLGKNLWGGIVEGWGTGLQSDPITVQLDNAVKNYKRTQPSSVFQQGGGGMPASADAYGDPAAGRKAPRGYLMPTSPAMPSFTAPSFPTPVAPMGITGSQLDAATAAMKKSQKETRSEAEKTKDALIKRYDAVHSKMLQEIALEGRKTEVAKITYAVQSGNLKDITESQKQELIQYARKVDKINAESAALKKSRQDAKQTVDELKRADKEAYDQLVQKIHTTKVGGEASKIAYEIQYGALKGLSAERKKELVDLARRADAETKNEEAIAKSKSAYKDMRDNLAEQIHQQGLLTNVQKTGYAIQFGDLKKLTTLQKVELMNMAQILDNTEIQTALTKKLKDLTGQVNLSAMPKDLREVIGAAGGVEEWMKLAPAGAVLGNVLSKAQKDIYDTYNILKDNEALNSVDDMFAQLSRDSRLLGDEVRKAAIEAVGGFDVWKRLGDGSSEIQKNIMHAVATAKGVDELYQMQQDYAKQAADAVKPLQTSTQQVESAIDSLLQRLGLAATDPQFQAFIESMKSSAKQIDQATAGKELSGQMGEQFDRINELSRKIGGLYTPGMEAAAQWEAQNKQLIQDLKAADGDDLAQQMIDQYEDILNQAEALDQYNQGLEQTRKLHEDLYAKTLQMGETDPFKRWLDSLKVYDWSLNNGMGGFKLPDGMNEDNLHKLFDYQQRLDFALDTASKISGVLTDAFDNAYDNGFKGFFTSVTTGFRKMMYQMAVEYLQSELLRVLQKTMMGLFHTTAATQPQISASGGSGGGGFGSLIGGIAGSFLPTLIGGVFGGGSKITSASIPKPAALPTYPTYFAAGGGTLIPGEPTLVGENGPEVVMTRSRGMRVIPNHELSGGGTSTPVTVYMTVQTPDAQGFRRSSSVISTEIAQGISKAQRRNRG